jgi:hypothetical protein
MVHWTTLIIRVMGIVTKKVWAKVAEFIKA